MSDLRPYPATGMTTERWKAEVQPSWVSLSDLVFTQPDISLICLLRAIQGHPNYAGDDYVHVVLWRGTHYLEDGHHRVARDLLQGRDAIMARVLEVRE